MSKNLARFFNFLEEIVLIFAAVFYPLILALELIVPGFFSHFFFLEIIGFLGIFAILTKRLSQKKSFGAKECLQFLIIFLALITNLTINLRGYEVDKLRSALFTLTLLGLTIIGAMTTRITHPETRKKTFPAKLKMDSLKILALIPAPYFLLRLAANFYYIGADEGSYIYDALLLNQGFFPIKDFVTRALPQLYFYASFIKILGPHLWILKILNAIVSSLTVAAIYKIGEELEGKKVALIAALLYIISPLSFLSDTVTSTIIFEVALTAWGVYFLIHYLKDKKEASLFFSGMLFAAGFLVRKIPAVFIIAAGFYLLKGKKIKSLRTFLAGIAIPILLATVILLPNLGLTQTFQVLGPGLVVVQEARQTLAASLHYLKLGTILSGFLLAGIAAFFLIPREQKPGKKINLLIFWIGALVLLYGFYTVKRGLTPKYLSELTAPFSLLAGLGFVRLLEDTHKRHSERGEESQPSIFNISKILLVAITVLISLVAIKITPFGDESVGYPLMRIIGSGFSRQETKEIVRLIQTQTEENDVILGGSLHWATFSGRKQFLDISHPLIYEQEAEVYTLYNAPDEQEIKEIFINQGPKLVLRDLHFELAFDFLIPELEHYYRKIYETKNVGVYKRL